MKLPPSLSADAEAMARQEATGGRLEDLRYRLLAIDYMQELIGDLKFEISETATLL